MIRHALAALALGGFLILPGCFETLYAQPTTTVSPDLIDRYRQILATDQGNLTLHYLLGVALLQDNQNAAALAEFQTAYPAYQESIEAHYNLAITSLRLKDLGSAEIYLDQAIALGATDTPGIFPVEDLYFNMALISQETGDANEAIRYFQKVLSLAPQRYEVYRQLGDLHAHRNDTDLAIKSFHTYLKQFPDDPVSRDYLFALEFNRAQDLLAADDFIGAASGFSVALEIQPDSPTALYYLGYIAYAQNKPGQAVILLSKAFSDADPSLQQTIRPLLYNSALSLRKNGNAESALQAVTTLAEQKNALFSEVFLAGTLNLDLGNYRAAHDYLQRAVALDPQNQGAMQNLLASELGAFNEWLSITRVSLRAEQLDEAEIAWQEARNLQPQNSRVAALRKKIDQARLARATVNFFNAQVALDAGETTAAFDQVRTGLAVQPDSPDGLALQVEIKSAMTAELSRILTEADQALHSGDWVKATEDYSRVLEIEPQQPAAVAGLEQTRKARQQHSLSLLAEGQEALDAGQTDQAVNAFTQLLALEPGHEQARNGLKTAHQMQANRLNEFLLRGRQALGHDHFQEARKWFNQALAVDDSTRAEQELARLEQRVLEKTDELASQAEGAAGKGQYKQARQLFAQALALTPTHSRSLTGQANLTVQVKDIIKAKLQQATRANQQNDYQQATYLYRSILDIAPDNRDALNGLKKNRQQQADSLDTLVKQGQEALDAGDLAIAEQYLTEALAQDAYHKDAQQLRQRLEQVRQTGAQPGDEQKLYLQGVAYYTQGKYAEAIESWQTVLLLNPDHEKANQNIDKTRRKMRQIEEYRGV